MHAADAHRYPGNEGEGNIKDENLRREFCGKRHEIAQRTQDRTDIQVNGIDSGKVEVDVLSCRSIRHGFLVTFDGYIVPGLADNE